MMLSLLKPSVSSSGVVASKLSRKDVFEAAKLKKSFRAQCAESVCALLLRLFTSTR